MRIAHGVSHLLKGTPRREHGEGGGKGYLSAGGEPGRYAHHIALGYAALNKSIRVRLAKIFHLSGVCQVSHQHNNILVVSAQFHQGLAEALPGSLFNYLSHMQTAFLSCLIKS